MCVFFLPFSCFGTYESFFINVLFFMRLLDRSLKFKISNRWFVIQMYNVTNGPTRSIEFRILNRMSFLRWIKTITHAGYYLNVQTKALYPKIEFKTIFIYIQHIYILHRLEQCIYMVCETNISLMDVILVQQTWSMLNKAFNVWL